MPASSVIAPLNGAQIEAVISIVERIRAGDLDASAAMLLMVAAGMPADAAKQVADSVAMLPAATPDPTATVASMQSAINGVKGLSLDTVEKLENEIHEIGVFNGLLSGFNVSKK
jgi:hypothetical protein